MCVRSESFLNVVMVSLSLQLNLFTIAIVFSISLFLQGCADIHDEEALLQRSDRCPERSDFRHADVEMLRARRKWVKKHRAHPTTNHDILFVVKLKSHRQLRHTLLDRSNLASPNYGKWLTSEEARSLTLNHKAVRAIHDALETAGVSVVKTTRGGELVRAKASVQVWERFLQCKFHVYESHEKDPQTMQAMTHVAANNYSVPSHLSEYVDGILRTVELPGFRSASVKVSALAMRQGSAITPEVIRRHYNVPSVAPKGSLEANITKNTSQAVFASLGQHWSPSDLKSFQGSFGLPDRPVTELDSHHMASDLHCRLRPDDCAEANLDVQWMIAMSPWSKMGFYYEDESRTFTDFLEDLLDMSNPPQVVSISYGEPEIALTMNPALRRVFDIAAMKLGVQGVTVIAASGDDGAQSSLARSYNCSQIDEVGLQVTWPASSPYVTAVGATMGVESGREERACQIQCQIDGKKCYPQGEGPSITSGGGYSAYGKPDYQIGHVNCKGRGIPDVSLAGHAYVVVVGGQRVLVDGTSASAPVLGGMVSLINAKRLASGRPPVGFINPAMYQHASAFNDITLGDNKCGTFDGRSGAATCCGGFDAGPGWDAATGLGSVDFQKFAAIFATSVATSYKDTVELEPVVLTII